MPERRYNDGEVIFAKGEASEALFRIESGSVMVERSGADGRSIGVVLHHGEIFGAAGLLSGGLRAGLARAIGATTLATVQLVDLVRLIESGDGIVKSLLSKLFDGPDDQAVGGGEAEDGVLAGLVAGTGGYKLALLPTGTGLTKAMGVDRLEISRLPFLVGRKCGENERAAFGDVSLMLDDHKPYHISRRHFSIELSEGKLCLRDFASHHGTKVNGLQVGGRKRDRMAPLKPGRNDIVAGRKGSPFRFVLVVEPE